MDAQGLRDILDKVMSQKDLQPFNDDTFCNIALDRIFSLAGVVPLRNKVNNMPLLANSMVECMQNSPSRFKKISGEESFIEASLGKIVIAAREADGHGHVAVVYPTKEMGFSGSWKKKVPYLANIGKKVGILRSSQCFMDEPDYFKVI